MGNAALFHELTRPRGERWTWSLEAEQAAGSLSLGVVWERGITLTPATWALRGFFALSLAGFALLYDWVSIPWPRWSAKEARPVEIDRNYYYGPCGCAPPLSPEVEAANGDSTKLVHGLSGGEAPAPSPETGGRALP